MRVNVVKNRAKEEPIFEHPAVGGGGFLVDSPESKKRGYAKADVSYKGVSYKYFLGSGVSIPVFCFFVKVGRLV